MKEYMLLFRGGLNFDTASPEILQSSMMKWRTWMDGLAADGKLIGGDRLVPTGTSIAGKQKQLTDGPFAEGKELVGGYLAIKAESLEQATQIAMDCPIYDYDGSTEIREIFKMND